MTAARLGGPSDYSMPPIRLRVTAAMLIVMAIALGARLAQVQLVESDAFLEWGDRQHLREIPLPANRGTVVDRNGLVLSVSVAQNTIWADPRLITDPTETAMTLSPIVGVEAHTLIDRLSDPERAFAYIARQVTDEVAAEVDALALDGIGAYEEPRRFNPAGADFARSILGRTDVDNLGISGIEAQYDDLLTGTPGTKLFERTKSGAVIPTGEFHLDPAVTGDSLVLTIDQTLQFETERRLVEQVEATGSQGGTVIMMDNRTGEVLAMANADRSEDGFVGVGSENKALTWTYEPGSIAKPLTFAGVFEHNLGGLGDARAVADRRTYNADSEEYRKTFSDHTDHDTMLWTPADILRESSNVGTIMWAEDLGEEALYETLVAFGIGRDTAIDFPSESSGIFHPLSDWQSTSLPTIAIGQGVATTPMQMALAYATIANGGVEIAPTLVQGSTDAAGVFTPHAQAEPRRVISERTAAMLTTALTDVVASGTGANAAIPGYDTAGKTGTSWKPQANGTYEDELGRRHYVASFAGYLPAADPRVTILVVMDDPSGDRDSGSRAAAPLFAELSRFAVQYLRIPPTTTTAAEAQHGEKAITTADVADIQATSDGEAASDESAGSDDTTDD